MWIKQYRQSDKKNIAWPADFAAGGHVVDFIEKGNVGK